MWKLSLLHHSLYLSPSPCTVILSQCVCLSAARMMKQASPEALKVISTSLLSPKLSTYHTQEYDSSVIQLDLFNTYTLYTNHIRVP